MSVNNYHQHLHKKHKNINRGNIDKLVYLAVIMGPLMALPQIYSIWVLKEEASIISWTAWLIIAFIWLIYGLKHKIKPIINVHIMWIIVDIIIVLGLLKTTY